MNLHFICPHCGQHLEGDVPPVGSDATCPSCGNGFKVAAAVPARHHHHAPDREQLRREEARGKTMFFLIIGGAALLLGLLGWGVSVALSWREDAREVSGKKPGAVDAFVDVLKQQNEWRNGIASGKYRGSGTGFWISEDGWLLTSHGVTGNASKVDVRTAAGKIISAKVTATDEKLDIALLQAEFKPAVWLPVSTEEPGIGDNVFTVGFPDTLVQGVPAKFTGGRISSLTGIRDDKSFYQTSVPVQPGNSGGALAHSKTGWVVGMMTLKPTAVAGGGSADNVSYALKSALLQDFIKKQNAALGAAVQKSTLPANATEREVISRVEQATALVLVE